MMKNGGMDQYMYRTDMWNVVRRMCIGNGGVVSAFLRDASRASVRGLSGHVYDNDGKVEVKKNDEYVRDMFGTDVRAVCREYL
jgi:hypothetical protein